MMRAKAPVWLRVGRERGPSSVFIIYNVVKSQSSSVRSSPTAAAAACLLLMLSSATALQHTPPPPFRIGSTHTAPFLGSSHSSGCLLRSCWIDDRGCRVCRCVAQCSSPKPVWRCSRRGCPAHRTTFVFGVPAHRATQTTHNSPKRTRPQKQANGGARVALLGPGRARV